MNLNDLRTNAYTKNTGNDSSENTKNSNPANNKQPVIKPFIPVKLNSSEIKNNAIPQNTFSSNSKTAQNATTFSFQSFNSTQNNNHTVEQNKVFQNVSLTNLSSKRTMPSEYETNKQLNNSIDYIKNNGLLKVPAKQTKENGNDSVYRRVAKFLVLIGENEAAKILPHLSEKQIDKIIPEIASIRTIDKQEAEEILSEFNNLLDKARQTGGAETAKDILEKAYGKERAEQMFNRAVPFEGKKPFEYLNDADNEKILDLLKNENTGIQALIISHLEPKKAAAIINKMDDETKKDVILHLAKMEKISPEIINKVDQAIHEKSLKYVSEKTENIDGKNALAQILKKMDATSEKDILSYLSEDDPDLGNDLRNRLFTLDDLLNADDRFIQEKLREMTDTDICYLLAGKTEEFRSKIVTNISSGRRTSIFEQEQILKPIRKADADKTTSLFFSELRRAYEEGHLIIKDRNDDIYV